MSSRDVSAGDGVAEFRRHERRVRGIAYRMLGEMDAADDVVQDAWLRFASADRSAIDNVEAWLVTVSTRLAIDRLRAAKAARQSYVGPWLPEPIETDGGEAAAHIELAADLSLAFLVVLESLDPVERAAFLLHDGFDVDYGQVARVIGRSEVATRQIVHRARTRVAERRPRFEVEEGARDRLLSGFLDAARSGDVSRLAGLLKQDAILWSDGGGRAKAALNPIRGADRIARFLAGVARKQPAHLQFAPCILNGAPGIVGYDGDRPVRALCVDVGEGADGPAVRAVFIVTNPDKLRGLLDRASPSGGERMAAP
jgi:RNA polymerase sigma-70 factor (ECF subfamily)